MNNIKAGGENNIKTDRQRTSPTKNVNLGTIAIHTWQACDRGEFASHFIMTPSALDFDSLISNRSLS